MYTKHFDLTEEPFTIAANPRFLYMSARHREALAHLLYGIRSDSGFVMLSGEVGTGKTTVCRSLMEQLPEQANVAFILNPRVTVIELLSSICDEFGIEHEHAGSSVKTLVDEINAYLLDQHAQGRNTVVIIDEAQNLSFDVLEQLRLLTNLETNERKLLRIILLGQPELETMLARPELKQVEQRITARYRLQPLNRDETRAYIAHRLAVAGSSKPLFSTRALDRIYAHSKGVPRLINVVCDRAMLGAYVKSRYRVDPDIVSEAISEVQGRSERKHRGKQGAVVAVSLLAGAVAVAALMYRNESAPSAVLVSQEDSSPEREIPGPGHAEAAAGTIAATGPAPGQAAQAPEPGSINEEIPAAAQISDWPQIVVGPGHDATIAYTSLFQQWGRQLSEHATAPCAEAFASGLRCYTGTGNLGTLANNDRPAILTLLDDQGREYRATMLALDERSATLVFPHGVQTVYRRDLEVRWKGQYQILWKMSPQGLSIFRPGEQGSGITWLTRGLIAAGIDSLQQKDYYDADVMEAVMTFQRQRGLVADGIAGRQTLMHLNSVNDPMVPRLGREASV